MRDHVAPIEFDVETTTYRARYDPSAIDPSLAVVSMLGSITDCDVADLAPLHDVIDPQSFDRLLHHARTTPHGDRLQITFRYAGHLVTVFGDGQLEVEPVREAGQADDE
ncbi:HalOD1 output domain-containing protein [Natrinema salifodinae]|uniref:Halobacterial output domain-containing protein n=1 Tax=Natrinema salifodinae TaxID=1202768 RepID=A0A1I0PHT2_9EURY|nr:HalOD1 output domain-containing protein [Natrinema salifodinae]SEW13277.1 hypothetical protein SAMN05216285_2526 [Natrinema salifodinae]